ncbi:MAG: chlorophyll synthesis pathway protein BchC [Methyloversatilis sp.]|jgi:3-hydroxyethyl bacteriochlorophyllide a dehydrogenase|nr:chlorophyll synthesis pathway protein BchC [Methyloversatilis sp.]MBP6194145.1 chlorophyll synthesis pathway protein BchC [Methyloversatilis sp.]MBP9117718.1 chlorophyll synthesis pathway protein BchC [Methyloversatilis sp.]
MNSIAVVLKKPEQLELNQLVLTPAGDADVVVDVEWSGISTGTERLLWSGRMPPFPGMGYPLVPGYESVGRVTARGPDTDLAVGDHVFVPGARCFGEVRGLFGGAASRLVVPAARIVKLDQGFGERGILLALAATAQHAIAGGDHLPDLIVGHGVLGRMIARLTVAAGGDPVVWERNPMRAEGAEGYGVIDPELDDRRNYRCICDVSGDGSLLDTLISRLAPHGEIVLAGFYEDALSFNFPPAFMREARLRIAAQWQEGDLVTVRDMAASGQLSLDGLITHRQEAARADAAYRTAFSDPACLKMILDWRSMS